MQGLDTTGSKFSFAQHRIVRTDFLSAFSLGCLILPSFPILHHSVEPFNVLSNEDFQVLHRTVLTYKFVLTYKLQRLWLEYSQIFFPAFFKSIVINQLLHLFSLDKNEKQNACKDCEPHCESLPSRSWENRQGKVFICSALTFFPWLWIAISCRKDLALDGPLASVCLVLMGTFWFWWGFGHIISISSQSPAAARGVSA